MVDNVSLFSVIIVMMSKLKMFLKKLNMNKMAGWIFLSITLLEV